MGRFDTSNVAKIELHNSVAVVSLQTHCVWFQRRDSVKLAIEHVMIGGATNYIAPRHEPKSLIVRLVGRFDVRAAVFVVQLLVGFPSLRIRVQWICSLKMLHINSKNLQ